ncbi:MAG: hypothetical protein DCF28_02695 [Alphaproteobacteria bacterium]|nr:MAG: hypothetical protein DCF28_02695 [Alphaproteobacteria bacterium]PZO41620.1 MAG: hypothetical protein DCE92_00350 [Alphaproteobacteria bacterium]
MRTFWLDGVGVSIADDRFMLGWEDQSSSDILLARTLGHFCQCAFNYDRPEETSGAGQATATAS